MRRWTEQDIQSLGLRTVNGAGVVSRQVTQVAARVSKPTKYRSKATWIDGKRFPSKLEARCYEGLKLRQAAKDVLWFVRQVRYELEGGVVYVADFVAMVQMRGEDDGIGYVEVIDATGRMTPMKRDKLKQMKARFDIDVILWTDKAA